MESGRGRIGGGVRVTVLARRDWPPGGVSRSADALAEATGASRMVIGRGGWPGRPLFDPLRVRTSRADLLHLDTSARPRAILRDAALLRCAVRPVVVRVHGMERLLPRASLAEAYGRATAVVASCARHAQRLAEALNAPVGVLSPGFVPHPARRRRDRSERVVLFGGRTEAAKGFDRLVTAMEGLDARLRVAGDGPLPGGERLGWLAPDAWRAELADADLLCLPSWDEGMPVVLLEAMAAQVPVVATAVGGIPDLVRDGVDGRVLPVGVTPAALREALRALLADDDARREMGAAARDRVAQHEITAVAAEASALWIRHA
jgi:glycosyltransferase involved in cell wall biosynthesis